MPARAKEAALRITGTLLLVLCLEGFPSRIEAAGYGDEQLQEAVETALQSSGENPGLLTLKVRCDAGILTLGGTAPTLSVLRAATRRAAGVPGIVDIVITATIPRRGIPDSQISTDVQKALSPPAIPAGSVQVTVSEGRVTLKGSCGTYSCKLVAEEEASKVAGVVEIANRIQTTSETNLSEEGLARLVKSRLSSTPTPVPGKIQVEAHLNSVTLRGRVPLYLNRLQASEAALSVPGIASVDNRLIVDPTMIDSNQPQTSP